MTKNLDLPEYYINREWSWLAFNKRVLEEARDKDIPLLERLRFLAITASNLDEFCMVRVASLINKVNLDYHKPDIAGWSPKQQLEKISEYAHIMINQQYSTYNRMLQRLLKENSIEINTIDQLTQEQLAFIDHYFNREIYPVITPMAVDASRPFPLIVNKSLNLVAFISKKGKQPKKQEFVTVQIPTVLPRVIRLPDDTDKDCFILLEDIIKRHLDKLFIGFEIDELACYRVIRDMDLEVDEEESEDLLKKIETQIRMRERRDVIHLDVEANMSQKLLAKLVERLGVEKENIYIIHGPLDLTFLSQVADRLSNREQLFYEKHRPFVDPGWLDCSIFDLISKQDLFLHHPYDAFDPVISFIKQAAFDSSVLAIKMTLYRVSGHSPIVHYLELAAEKGKQVTVLVELKARFDEENNIHWAQRLEKAGCHVIYGLIGLKTHCKLTLVVRKEQEGIKRYMHIGTGNYNDSTAKVYTDMGLLTSNVRMGIDASNIFNMLTGYSEPPYFNKLRMAPQWLRHEIMELIEKEIQYAKSGKNAYIDWKMNSLSDEGIIKALYRASIAGVKIRLLVRGICCLRPGLKGISENITVHSIVGRYLEHSRIYIFSGNGAEKVYLSSADMMPRNLNRRVELLFPIEDADIKKNIVQIFATMINDNVKTRVMNNDGTYSKVDRRGKAPLNAQAFFADEAEKKAIALSNAIVEKRTFTPIQRNEITIETEED
ncbi:RNA degradosome polyphosphate kinase [Bacillaceae bacterium Marseille-Q3522]|nr:RNA degradosome polyphosphate kinase [Bacillaceae bacterium Marseille-Q3522]